MGIYAGTGYWGVNSSRKLSANAMLEMVVSMLQRAPKVQQEIKLLGHIRLEPLISDSSEDTSKRIASRFAIGHLHGNIMITAKPYECGRESSGTATYVIYNNTGSFSPLIIHPRDFKVCKLNPNILPWVNGGKLEEGYFPRDCITAPVILVPDELANVFPKNIDWQLRYYLPKKV